MCMIVSHSLIHSFNKIHECLLCAIYFFGPGNTPVNKQISDPMKLTFLLEEQAVNMMMSKIHSMLDSDKNFPNF